MKYGKIQHGIFLSRPNRFIAHVEIDGQTQICHVKNTGRCRELLLPGVPLILEDCQNPGRKTRYDVIAVKKKEQWINMDSQVPNKAAAEWISLSGIFSEKAVVKMEKKYGNSRFDLYIEDGSRQAFMEVKGVTLEEGGIARFPDAPTARGVKHMEELCKCVSEGYEAYVLFVIQMKGIEKFQPNWNTHREFGEALVRAKAAGVKLLAYDCVVTEDSIILDQPVPIDLETERC